MGLSIITLKLKDIAIVQTHIIPLLQNNTSGNNILKTSILSYHPLKIVSFNQPAFMAFLKMEQLLLNIILDNNYEDELAYVFNVYRDDIDPMQVQTEAFSMSTMLQGSNCKNFSNILEHLESLHLTKCAIILNLLTIVHLILINPAISCTPETSFSVARRIKTWLRSTMTTKQFTNLYILPIHKELTDSINLVDIGNEFASKYDGRRMNLGKFVPSGLV